MHCPFKQELLANVPVYAHGPRLRLQNILVAKWCYCFPHVLSQTSSPATVTHDYQRLVTFGGEEGGNLTPPTNQTENHSGPPFSPYGQLSPEHELGTTRRGPG